MTKIDDLGRQAGADARADAARLASARVELGLEQLRLDVPIVVAPRRRVDRRRWVALGSAAALSAAAIVAVVVNSNEEGERRIVPSGTSTDASTASTLGATTTVADTEPPSTVATSAVVPTGAIAVSHGDLPPAFPASALVGMTDQTQVPLVAIGDTHIVTVEGSTATLIDPIDPSSNPQPVRLDVVTTGSITAGPGDVLYAVVQGEGTDMSLDAIALSGTRAGQVLVSTSVTAVEFAEAPVGVLGHGRAGIIDRRTGDTLLSYVDETGRSISLDRPTHQLAVVDGDVGAAMTIRDPDGAHEWNLTIDRDPTSPGTFSGEAPPAPSSHGGAVVWTALGPPEDPSADFPTPTESVVAVLVADGTGTWYSLTDGWQVGASDLDGTILVRLNGSTVELARLDPPQRFDFVNQPAAPQQRVSFAATLPTSLTTAEPCTVDNLDVVPTNEGAAGTTYGVLNVRNKGSEPCEISGVPDVALLDDAGDIVQSTDPTLIGPPGVEPIVLVTDSWASSLLGAIASNVCGGNGSSQIRVTIAGQSTSLPFAVGRPVDPTQCAPTEIHDPVPGALVVQPFEPIPPNEDAGGSSRGPQIALEAPSTVRAGDVLRYDIVYTATEVPFELSNAVDGANCPVYRESLGAATAQLLLNCNGSAGILIRAGESVRFHIELPIPADAVLGAATLTWTLIEPAGATVSANVAIVA